MSKQGVIPARPGKENIPLCLAYIYTKATIIPWRNKSRKWYDALKNYTTRRVPIGR